MATRIHFLSSSGWTASLAQVSGRPSRKVHVASLGDALLARFRHAQGLWLSLGAVWLGSIVMNLPVGGPGFGPLDLALAINRGGLGLVICLALIPKLMGQGRYLLFAAGTATSAMAFGAAHMYVVGPLIEASSGQAIDCYRCYVTQTLPTVATMAVIKLSWSLMEYQKGAAIIGRERSDAELRFLRTQMNPHLLMNSLNNVYSYALERSERAPEMILKLSGVLRYMLYEVGDGRVPLRRELDYINDYFELQRLSTEGRGEVRLSVEGEPYGWEIAPLLLIVPIENCFKHAIETVKPLLIDVSIRVEDGILYVNTLNNLGDEQTAHRREGVGGIGLENIRRRLELLYPGRFQLETSSQAKLFRASLSLSLDRE